METKNKNLTDCQTEVSGVNVKALVNIVKQQIQDAVWKFNKEVENSVKSDNKLWKGVDLNQHLENVRKEAEARVRIADLSKDFQIQKDGFSVVLGCNVDWMPNDKKWNMFNWSSLKIDGRKFNSKDNHWEAFSVPNKIKAGWKEN